VAVPKRKYCEATAVGTDGVVVQTRTKRLNNHPGASRHPSCPGTAVQIRQKETVWLAFSFGFWVIFEILKNDTSICCPN
jgi:hypothetical protein